jgi:hypothetical protein
MFPSEDEDTRLHQDVIVDANYNIVATENKFYWFTKSRNYALIELVGGS